MRIAYFERRQPIDGSDADDVVELGVWDSSSALMTFLDERDDAEPGVDTVAVAWWVNGRNPSPLSAAQARLAFMSTHGPSPFAFMPREPWPRFSIDRVWLDDADVQLLISQLNSDLYSRYPEPEALIFNLHPADVVDGVGALLMAVDDSQPVGCIAFRVVDDQPGTAEIKRMYVCLAGRGRKIGAALLFEVERLAAELGVHRFILETGPRQPEAMQRFRQAGYVECAPWGEFVGKDLSICMEKVVSSTAPDPSTDR